MIANKKKIYESPDGGITIRSRDIGDTNPANTVTITSANNTNNTISTSNRIDNLAENYMWGNLNSAKVEVNLHKQYPKLKEKWKEYQDLEMHYKAWELLKK
jgi:hypothetical protein